MKNLLYVIILFFPVTVVSQPILFGSSVTSNKWKNVGNPLFSESTIDFHRWQSVQQTSLTLHFLIQKKMTDRRSWYSMEPVGLP